MFVSTDGSLNLVSAAVTGLILPCYPTLVGNVILMRRSLRSEQRDHWCSTPPRLEVDDGQHGGFGAFTAKKRDAPNPHTGETVPVDEKVVPFFKAGKELRERVNRSDRAAGAIG